MIRIFLLIVLFLLHDAYSFAGPFGTNMYDAKEKFSNITKYSSPSLPGETYLASELPKLHSAFSSYLLIFGDNGLCGVAAMTKKFDHDRSGSDARLKYEELKGQLSEKYGVPKSIEFLKAGALWKNDNEFVSSLFHNERMHMCEWEFKDSDEIKRIYMLIQPQDQSCSTVVLFYLYKNYDELKKKEEIKEKNAL